MEGSSQENSEMVDEKKGQPLPHTKHEKVQTAIQLKQQGNDYFRAKEYKKALSSYHKALMYINGFQSENEPYYQYAKQDMRLGSADGDLPKTVQELFSTIYLNMAQIHLFLGNFQKALEKSQLALEKQPNSIKGYYRRGISYMELKDFDRARSDFAKVQELDPNFTEVTQKLEILSQREHIEDKKS